MEVVCCKRHATRNQARFRQGARKVCRFCNRPRLQTSQKMQSLVEEIDRHRPGQPLSEAPKRIADLENVVGTGR